MLLVCSCTKTAVVFKYANALRDLKEVADGCFRKILADDLKECVDKFKSSYIKTGLPIASKGPCNIHPPGGVHWDHQRVPLAV